MRVATYEAIVKDGEIKLPDSLHLPEHARVYIVIPDVEETTVLHVGGPRLAKPLKAIDFEKEVTQEPPDAGL